MALRATYLYFRRNPGAAFILGFQVLLLGAVIELFLGSRTLSNDLGVYAFASLIIGLMVQTIRALKDSYGGGKRSHRGKVIETQNWIEDEDISIEPFSPLRLLDDLPIRCS